MNKLQISVKDMYTIKEIATKLWLESKDPVLLLVHLKAFENFLITKGIDPQFTIKKVEE